MTQRRSVAVTNVFGPLNRGDFELFHQLLTLINAQPAVDVHAVARQPESCRQFFPDATFHEQPGVAPDTRGKQGKAIALLRTGILYVAAWIPAAERLLPRDQRSSLAAIRDAELVIACPGGYLTNSSWSFYPQLAQLEYATRRGPDVWLAPMSIGPATGRLNRWLLGRTLKAVDRMYVRESWSEQYCRDAGHTPIRSADLAYQPAREWLALDQDQAPKQYITATVVRWEFPGDPEPQAARERYHAAMAQALNETSARYDLPVKLLLQVDNDQSVTEAVASRLSVNHDIVRVDTPDEYREILRGSRLMIGSRFHSAIFAMTAGCPTVVVSYLPKAQYMMEDMDLAALVHDISRVSAEGLQQSIDLLEDPQVNMAQRTSAAILAQTARDANPFIADLAGALEFAPVRP